MYFYYFSFSNTQFGLLSWEKARCHYAAPYIFPLFFWMRYLYFGILISHIFFSIVVVPLVLRTYARAYLKDYARHRKLARITFPIWLYVAVTGVVVYLMISPYYPY